MRQKRTFITILLIIAFLCLGIAYAAIGGVTLKISGDIAATAAEGEINVQFTQAQITENDGNATASANISETNAQQASINVSGLKTEGQSVTATYTIENKATDIAATLGTPAVVVSNTEWFDVECTLSGNSLDKNSSTTEDDTQTATVVVKLKKTPVSADDQEAAQGTVTIDINATPVANREGN